MIFRPELAAKVLAGEKTVTRRRPSKNMRSPWYIGRCSLHVGKQAAVQPGRGQPAVCQVRIRSVGLDGWPGWISEREARAEGFESPAAFVEMFERLGGKLHTGDLLWRVEFRVIPAAVLAAGHG